MCLGDAYGCGYPWMYECVLIEARVYPLFLHSILIAYDCMCYDMYGHACKSVKLMYT